MRELLRRTYSRTAGPINRFTSLYRSARAIPTLTLSTDTLYRQEMRDEIIHSFQTPLTILQSAFELIPKDASLENQKLYALMHSNILTLSTLTQNLLRHAYADTVLPAQSSALFSVSEVVRNVVRDYEPVARQKQILLSSTIPAHIEYFGDVRDFTELIVNILHNALRYTGNGAENHVHIALRDSALGTDLIISDTGIGISAERLPYIFERFSCARKTGADGCGLGLAIAKRIVDQNGGTMTFTSELGVGTTVTIIFPHR